MMKRKISLEENGINALIKISSVEKETTENTLTNSQGNSSTVWSQQSELLQNEKVRQDRVGDLDNLLTLRLQNNYCLCVVNYSPFGLAVRSKSIDEIPLGEIRAKLFLRDVFVCDLNLRGIRVRDLPKGESLVGMEVIGKPIQVEHIGALIHIMNILEKNKTEITHLKEIPETFRLEVFELRSRLEQLEKDINELSTEVKTVSSKNLIDFELVVTSNAANFLSNVMVPAFKELSDALAVMDSEIKQKSLFFFRRQFEEFILKAPFGNRSLMKPLGYAGDYEVMNLIYRNQPEGTSLFGKSLHRHFIDQPAAKAVRNRIDYVISHLNAIKCISSAKSLRILSVASGPACELQRWLSTLDQSDQKFEIDLLDQDVHSLKHAQRCLMEIVGEKSIECKIKFFNQSIRRVLTRGLDSSDYDLVYSLGLFDYLSDPVCQALGKTLLGAVRKGGRLVIGNFDIDNPTRPIMELALDWKLIYRSRQDLENLFSPLGGRIEIEQEKEGVNLFCVIRK